MKRTMTWAAVALALVGLLTACTAAMIGGLDPQAAQGVTFRVLDQVNAKAIVPGGSENPGRYQLIGAGSTGQATGQTFNVSITAPNTSTSLNLAWGDWSVEVIVWSDEDPEQDLGGGTENFTVVVGTPQTVNVTCSPRPGTGTLAMDFSWVPDIILDPEVQVELKPRVGDAIDLSSYLTVDSRPGVTGSATLDRGWYTGAMRLLDNGQLSAGVVRAVKISKGRTTTWTEYLKITALEGQITMDVAYNPGVPLDLSSNITTLDATDPQGERLYVELFPGMTQPINITVAEVDDGQTVAYAWYRDGILTALSTEASYTLDGDDAAYTVGSRHYLSCVALQSDGVRAGDLQFAVEKSEAGEGQFLIGGIIQPAVSGLMPSGSYWRVDVYSADGSTLVTTTEMVYANNVTSVGWPYPGTATPLDAGTYTLRLSRRYGIDGTQYDPPMIHWWTGVNPSSQTAPGSTFTIPHAPGAVFDFWISW